MSRAGLAMLALGVWAAGAQAQPTVTWTTMKRQWPTSRLETTLVSDTVNHRLIAFGGYDHNWNRNREVWEYYPALQAWFNVTPTGSGPVPRSGAAMAFDNGRQTGLLFGGLNDARQFLGDTWLWNASTRSWTQTATGGTPGVHKPEPRQGMGLVYDASNDRYVLFGGLDGNRYYADTWTFNAATLSWSKLTTSSSSGNGRVLLARGFHGMTIAGNRIFILGGAGYEGTPPVLPLLQFEDLWELVGAVWTDRTPSGVAAGNNGACSTPSACPGKAGWRSFAHDPAGNRLVTQGGYTPAANLQSTYAYGLGSGTWSLVSATIAGNPNASSRDSHALAYAPSIGKLVLFGGYLSDVWELAGSTWTSPPAFDPRISYNPYTYPPQDRHALTWDSARARITAVTGGTDELWTLAPGGWNWLVSAVGGFVERVGHAIDYNAALDRVLLFGGRCKNYGMYQQQPDGIGFKCGPAGTYFNDLHAWNPGTGAWSTLAPSGIAPAPRWEHGFVYDPVNNEFVLFGGQGATGALLGDTQLLTCSGPTSCSWASVAGPAPSARWGHAMAFDPFSQRVVLFGGYNGSVPLNDVWAWNGATNTWSSVSPGGTPPSARLHAGLARADYSVPGLLMFAGRDAGGVRNDTWLLTGIGTASPLWQRAIVSGAPPAARENPELVFAPNVNRVVMQGGFDDNGLLPADLHFATVSIKGDLDTNGSTDLVLRSPATPNPVLWTMNGVNRVAELTASAALGAGEQVVAVDDFNYDGRSDLVIWNSASGAVSFWFMNGATRLGTAPLSGAAPLPTTWKPAASADFNHDGKPDLLWRNSSTQKLAIWMLSGTAFNGSFVPNPDQAIDPNWEVVGALDYNADGNTDLLWYNPNSGKIVFWYLDYYAVRYLGIFANPANAGDNNWKVLAAGNYGTFGGEPAGSKDLVWRNADSGRYVVWYMDNAGNRIAGLFTNPMNPSPDPVNWTIVGPK